MYLSSFKENHTETTVSFTIKAKKEKIDEWENESSGLYKKFKLNGSITTSNLVVFKDGTLTKMETPEDVLKDFYEVRAEFYVKRKDLLVENLQTEQRKLSNKARFVEEVCSGELVVSNRKRVDILHELQERGYETFNSKAEPSATEESEEEDNEEEELTTAELAKGYEYLLGMKIWSLTYEKAEALRAELAAKTQELEELVATTPNEIWLKDLEAIEAAIDERDEALSELASEEKRAKAKSRKIQAKVAKKTQTKKKKKDEWDSDLESDDDEIMISSDSSDDEKEVAKKPATSKAKQATKAASKTVQKVVAATTMAATKKVTKSSLETISLMDEDDGPSSAKSFGSTTSATSNGKKPAESVDVDEDLGLSLFDRLKKRSGESELNSLQVESVADDEVEVLAKKAQKRLSISSISPKSTSSEDSSQVVKKAAPAKKKAPAKKSGGASKGTTKAKAQVKKAPAKKKKATLDSDESSEDDFAFHSDDDEEKVAAVPKATAAASRSRRARATTTKKTKYSFSDDDDDDESDF